MISPPQVPQPSPRARIPAQDVCRYIAEMCLELREMARNSRLPLVAYLLDVVRLEAERIAARGRGQS